MRHDDIVDVAAGASHERIGKLLPIFRFTGGELLRIALFIAEDDFYSALRAHHRDLGIWPSKVDVAA